MKTYHVYIMASKLRVLYTGITGNLVARVWQHKQGQIKGSTQKYNCGQLVYVEGFGDSPRGDRPRKTDQRLETGKETEPR